MRPSRHLARTGAATLGLLTLCSAMIACKRGAPPTPYAPASQLAAKEAWRTPPGQKLKALVQTLEGASRRADPKPLIALIALETVLDRAMADIRGVDQFKGGFRTGVLRKRASFPEQVMAEGNSYRYLRTSRQGKIARLLFRFVAKDGGLNYHELLVTDTGRGELKIIDYYVYLTGELYSQSLRRFFLTAMPRQKLERLLKGPKTLTAKLPDVERMIALTRKGKWKAACAIYERLPAEVREDKTVLLAYTQAASQGDDKGYMAAIDTYLRRYPNDASAGLVSFDALFMRKQWAKALAAVESIDRSVSDPYLNTLRAPVLKRMGRLPEARRAAERALQGSPDLIVPYNMAVDVAIAQKDYAAVRKWLLKAEFEQRFADVGIDDPGFRKSPEYRKWLEQRKAALARREAP